MYFLGSLNLAVLIVPVASAAYYPRIGRMYRRTNDDTTTSPISNVDHSTVHVDLTSSAVSPKDKPSSAVPAKDQTSPTITTIPAKDQTYSTVTFTVSFVTNHALSAVETSTVPTKDLPIYSSVSDKDYTIPAKDRTSSSITTIYLKDQTSSSLGSTTAPAKNLTASISSVTSIPDKDYSSSSNIPAKDSTVPSKDLSVPTKDRTSSSASTISSKDQTYTVVTITVVPIQNNTLSPASTANVQSKKLTTLPTESSIPTKDLPNTLSAPSTDLITPATKSSTIPARPSFIMNTTSTVTEENLMTAVTETFSDKDRTSSMPSQNLISSSNTATKGLFSAPDSSSNSTSIALTKETRGTPSILGGTSTLVISVQTNHPIPSTDKKPNNTVTSFSTNDQTTPQSSLSSGMWPLYTVYPLASGASGSASTVVPSFVTDHGTSNMTVTFHMPLPTSTMQHGISYSAETSRSLVFTRTSYPNATYSGIASQTAVSSESRLSFSSLPKHLTETDIVAVSASCTSSLSQGNYSFTLVIPSSPSAPSGIQQTVSSKVEVSPSTVPTYPEVTYYTTLSASCMPSCDKPGVSVIVTTLPTPATNPGSSSEVVPFPALSIVSTYPGQGVASSYRSELSGAIETFQSAVPTSSYFSNFTYSFTLSPMVVSPTSGALSSSKPESPAAETKTSGMDNSSPNTLANGISIIFSAAIQTSSSVSSSTAATLSLTTTITLPGVFPLSATEITALPSVSTSEFSSTVTSSTVPVYTPGMLGNAYGGGYIVTPSILAIVSSTTTGFVTGVPPGYGFSMLPGVSTPIGGSIVLASPPTMTAGSGNPQDTTSGFTISETQSPWVLTTPVNIPESISSSVMAETQVGGPIPLASTTTISGSSDMQEIASSSANHEVQAPGSVQTPAGRPESISSFVGADTQTGGSILLASATMVAGLESTQETSSGHAEGQTQTLGALPTSGLGNVPGSVRNSALAGAQTLQTVSTQESINAAASTGSFGPSETSIFETTVAPGGVPYPDLTATSMTDNIQTLAISTMGTPANTPDSIIASAMAGMQSMPTVSTQATILESASSFTIGDTSIPTTIMVPGGAIQSEIASISTSENSQAFAITTMATGVGIPVSSSNITFAVPAQPSLPEVFQGVGSRLDKSVFTVLVMLLAVVVYL